VATTLAQQALVRTMRGMTTWFCDAHASWQKSEVENANGRLRRWLPINGAGLLAQFADWSS
jgi:transposase, IS30 family